MLTYLINRKKIAYVTVILFFAYCSCAQACDLREKQKLVKVGETSKAEVIALLGQPSEEIANDHQGVLVYLDAIKIPLFVSLIPIVGDVADGAELMHQNCEYIIQLDDQQIVSRHKIRDID
jgi:hypothetical protein